MDKFLSDKIKVISFLSMIMIVFLHSYNLTVNMKDTSIVIERGINTFIQEFISKGLTHVAVPLFFIISGFLFFLNIRDGSLNEFISKFRTRFKSLVIPYLWWSTFSLLIYLGLQFLPVSGNFFTKELVSSLTISELLDRIFVNPYAYQLWFLRDLILLILITPAIFIIIRYTNWLVVMISFIAWLFKYDLLFVSHDTLFFFLIGAYLGIKKIGSLRGLNSKMTYTLLFIWIMTNIVIVFLREFPVNFYVVKILYFLPSINVLIGIVGLWSLYDVICDRDIDISKFKLFKLTQFSFFIYVLHEPLLTILKKGFYFLIGSGEMTSLLIYFISPLLTISLIIIVGQFLKRYFPAIYSFSVGNR